MNHQSAPQSVRRAIGAAVVSIILIAVTSAIGIASLIPQTAAAVAGSPGNPGAPTVLFVEDFENNGSTTINPPVEIAGYVGATGQTYSASPFWSSGTKCNGIVVARDSAPATPPPDLCGGYLAIWNALKFLSQKLSNQFGDPGDQFTVASYTAGASGVAPDDYLQLETNTPIALPSGGAYLTVSIDTGAYNCGVGAPNYFMYLTDAAGTKQSVVASGINPCTDPDAISDNSIDGRNALLVRTVGDAPVLVDSTSVVIEVENHNVQSAGNDATFDNIQLLDVSPQLDKTFESPVAYGSTSTITFTITNTYSPSGDGSLTQLDPKPGWQFTDQLPAGLTIVGSPTTGSGSEACANFDGAGTSGTTISATGDLSSNQAYCTVLVEVAATAPGSYTNAASDVTTVGLMPPIDASVTFTASPAVSIVKSAALSDDNTDAVASVGDTIGYSFVVTNTGNVPLVNIAVSDPLVGSVTCPSPTLAVGTSMVCTADTPHPVTQAELDSAQVPNTATVSAANSFDPATTVDSSSSITTPLAAAPELEFVKTAETPIDTNSSGLVDAGDTIQYTFSVTNAGNVTVTGVTVNDDRAGTATCASTTLAPGESTTCSADDAYAITDADEAAGSVVNTASASGSTPTSGTITSNTDSTTTPVSTPGPALTIVKTADAAVDVNSSGLTDTGDTVQYRFTVTNSGNVPVANVAVVDDLAGSVTCDATTLAPGGSTTCAADEAYTITDADEAAGSIVNIAAATGTDPDGGAVTSSSDSTTTAVAAPAPSLVIDKSADAPTDVNISGLVDAGDTIQYRFVVTNNGNVPISNVVVTDNLAGNVTCDATALAPGVSTNCLADAVYTVADGDEAAGSVVNVASASGADPDNGAVNSAPASTTTAVATPAPSLVIDKSADSPVDVNMSGLTDAGDTIEYRFVVTNNGNVPVSNVAVNDALAGSVSCTTTSLAPGASTDCVVVEAYTVTENDEASGSVVNSASASGLDPDNGTIGSNTDSTTTSVDTPVPSLAFTKTAGTPTDVNSSMITDAGDTIRYTFTVTNTGNVPLTSIAVTDPLVGPVSCLTTVLAVGGSTDCAADAVYTVTVADQSAGSADNTASASGLDPDAGSVESNTDSTSTPVDTPAPALTLTKTAGTPVDVNASTITDAGDTIQYTFTVTNSGNVPITSVRVDDPLVGTVTCDATSLAVGAVTDCSADAPYVVTVADETAATVDNTATAYGTSPDNVSIPSNTAATSTPVVAPKPSLDFVKSADTPIDVNSSGLTDAGDTIQYRFVVTNTGNVPVADVVVSDDRVGTVTCAVTELAVGESTDCAADAAYVVTADDEAAGSIENIASARAVDPDSGAVLSPVDNTITGVTTPAPSLMVDKSADVPVDVNSSGLVDAGDTIQYRFVVTNNGNVPLSGVAVVDDLVGSVSCAATVLAVGESTDCVADAVYQITEADEAAGSVVNVATAAGIDPDSGPVESQSDSASTTVATPAPSVIIDKSADVPVDANISGLVDAGDTIQYRFVVTNNGNVPLSGVAVLDDLVGSVSCAVTVLDVGESTECVADAVYVVTETDEVAGSVANTATAEALDPDSGVVTASPDSTTTPVSTPAPGLDFRKIADAPVDVNGSDLTDAGDTIQYRFIVTNTGNVPLTEIRVNDELVGSVTCDATILAAGAGTECAADAEYVVTSDDEAVGSVVNLASAAGVDPNGRPITSTVDSTTTAVSVPGPSLLFEKAASLPVDANSSGITDAGDTIRFSFKLTNNGDVPIADIVVDDDMIGAVTCSATLLGVGETAECVGDSDYVITDTDQDAGSVDNVASASGVDPDGESVASNTDSTTTTVDDPEPSLRLVKQAVTSNGATRSTPYVLGDQVNFRFTVTNTGNVTLTGVDVVDPMIGATTCDTDSLAIGASTSCTADEPYVVTAADVITGSLTNTASVYGVAPGGGEQTASSPASVTVEVRSLPTPPTTGSDVDQLLAAASVLVVAGLALLIAGTRRRATSA